ncbi:MAG: PQQ-like beta-propeller repeat protein [Gemmataceae bacterium]|nr:PQQ-like beta-propeller repeat protein [Gemmataceae bacterium]
MWRVPLASPGLGGVAASAGVVIVSNRELQDSTDVWRCYDADTGNQRWSIRYPATGHLDFGNSPRATPLIHDGVAYLAGAFGHLHAVDIATGKILWNHDTQAEFAAPGDLPWGHCGSPIIAGGRLLQYVGGPDAALVAFHPKTGKVEWQTKGARPGYGSLLLGTFGGVEQVIGYDESTLGGWDVATGKRLWSITPPRPKDFNVPTAIAWNDRIVVSTENNGTRMYRFDEQGRAVPQPEATFGELRPDTHTPVRVGDRLFGVHNGLYCLDLKSGLKPVWHWDDEALSHYTAAVASDTRVLLITMLGEAILLDATADKPKVLDRKAIADDENGLYAHPAFVGNRMYLRTADAIQCYELK